MSPRTSAAARRPGIGAGRLRRALLLSGALLAALALAAPLAAAETAKYEGASADGAVVVFSTTEALVPGDTDEFRDVYVRHFDPEAAAEGAYVTRLASVGPIGGNDAYNASFYAISRDGTRILFDTAEPLTEDDTDQSTDIYMRDLAEQTTVRVSQGNAACAGLGCGNGAQPAAFAGFAEGDHQRVLFSTTERLAPEDTDSVADVYVRDLETGATELVSAGGNAAVVATLRGVSADGSRAFFGTTESLDPADTDGAIDIYARDLPNGPTRLVSAPAAGCAECGNGDNPVTYAGSSVDGSRAYFETSEGLVGGDGDGANDVYLRNLESEQTRLVTAGEAEAPANFLAAAEDGTVFFRTAEPLVGGDENDATDIYAWEGDAPRLVTSGSGSASTFSAATADGEAVIFTTAEALAPGDTDAQPDVYLQRRDGGGPELVSAGAQACAPGCGNDSFGATFDAISADAGRVFFNSAEPLSPADKDPKMASDVYVRDIATGTTSLVSESGYCPRPNEICHARFGGISVTGGRAFFETEERLDLADGDVEADVYERELDGDGGAGTTRIVSVDNDPWLELGPAAPRLLWTDPESPGASTTPRIFGESDEGSTVRIYTRADCAGEVVGSGSAEELRWDGIEVSVASGETTSFWAHASDAEGDVSACSSSPLSYVHSGGGGKGGDGGGSGGGGNGGGGSSGGGPGAKPKPNPPAGPGGIVFVEPKTRITFGPGFKTRRRAVVFRFADTPRQAGTRFRCKVDRRAWRGCKSPLRVRGLGLGLHVFQVKAVNAIGVWEARPSKRRFKVVNP